MVVNQASGRAKRLKAADKNISSNQELAFERECPEEKENQPKDQYHPTIVRDNEEERVNFMFNRPYTSSPSEGILIEFDKCWPYGLGTQEPTNKNLVLFEISPACGTSSCPICQASQEKYVEIATKIKLEYNSLSYRDTQKAITKKAYPESILEVTNELIAEVIDRAKSNTYYTEVLTEEEMKLERYVHGYTSNNTRKITDAVVGRKICRTKVLVAKNLDDQPLACRFYSAFTHTADTSGIRIVVYKSMYYFYLNLHDNSWSKCTAELDERFFESMKRSLLSGNFSDGYLSKSVTDPKRLSDTTDFKETVLPEGFSLTLRDYQLRSLTWMKTLESGKCPLNLDRISYNFSNRGHTAKVKIKLGETGWYLDLFGKAMTRNPATSKVDPIVIKGGILADDTGSGKTITCLALVHAAPFTEESAKVRNLSVDCCLPYKIPSQATCIVCPSNLFAQWRKEAIRCNPNFKIVAISCMKDYQNYSLRQAILADLVIISYQFLTNNNYIAWTKHLSDNLNGVVDQLDETGKLVLTKIYFHRLIFDEIHEMGHHSVKCQQMAKSLKADFHWGITGTPKFDTPEDIINLFPYLDIDDEHEAPFLENKMTQAEFFSKFVKRNVPNLQLPPIEHKIVWVTATPDELALMTIMARQRSQAQQIMMCSHYQIADDGSEVVGGKFMPIEAVKSKLEKEKLMDMTLKETYMNLAAERLLEFKKLEPPEDALPEEKKTYDNKLSSLAESLKRETRIFNNSQSEYNFFLNVLKSFENPKGEDCLICRDTIQPDSLTMLPCSHFYCFSCISTFLDTHRKCPFCNRPVNGDSDIMRIKPMEESKKNLTEKGLDISKYGSKLIVLYNYLTDLLDNDPNASIILFLQYSVLSDFISATLNELSVKHVRVSGNVFKRQNAIDQFTSSKDVRLLMLSSEDSVSGMNLTQATHIILLHPFFTGEGESVDLAWEKQGICRAYRSGLDHPLQVVRFAVKGTIEEELTLSRQGKY